MWLVQTFILQNSLLLLVVKGVNYTDEFSKTKKALYSWNRQKLVLRHYSTLSLDSISLFEKLDLYSNNLILLILAL